MRKTNLNPVTLKKPEDLLKKIKEHVSCLYDIYQPEQSSHLKGSEQLIQIMVDMLLKANSQEELAFYISILIDMLRHLTKNQHDFLGTKDTVNKLIEETESFQKKLKNFDEFRDSIKKIQIEFIDKSKDLIENFKEHKNHYLAVKKLEKLNDQMLIIAQTTYINSDKIIEDTRTQIQKFSAMAMTHSADLVLSSEEEKIAHPPVLTDCLQLIIEFLIQRINSLEPLNSKFKDVQNSIGLLLSASGPIAEINSTLKLIISFLDIYFQGGCIAKDKAESSSTLSFIKDNSWDIAVFIATTASLITAFVTYPPAVPIILDTMGLMDLSKTGIKKSLELHEALSNKNLDTALIIADTFFKAVKADLNMKWERLNATHHLKEKIIAIDPEDKLKVKECKKNLKEIQQQQISTFYHYIVCGKTSNVIHQEIIKFTDFLDDQGLDGQIMYNSLLTAGKAQITAKILKNLIKKYNEHPNQLRDFLIELAESAPETGVKKLSAALDKPISEEVIKKFLKSLSTGLYFKKSNLASHG